MKVIERILDYRLSRDKAMLEYIYGYRNQIKYVVFVYSSGVEVIRVENIPYACRKVFGSKLMIKDFLGET